MFFSGRAISFWIIDMGIRYGLQSKFGGTKEDEVYMEETVGWVPPLLVGNTWTYLTGSRKLWGYLVIKQ